MSEFTNETARDMSRAEWQRSIGAIVCMRIADEVFAPELTELPDSMTHEPYDIPAYDVTGIDPYWGRAHRLQSEIILERLAAVDKQMPAAAMQGVLRHTHFGNQGSAAEVIPEGFRAQIHFPLNMAELISMAAKKQEIPGYELRTYGEIAELLRRPDFAELINKTLVVSNGYWERMSLQSGVATHHYDSLKPIDDRMAQVMDELVFTEEGTVQLGKTILDEMRDELRYVNKAGNSSKGPVSTRTSSGCPARHKRPHFAFTNEDQEVLQDLAKEYDVSIHDLLVARERNVVEDGLLFMADALDKFDAHLSKK